MSAPEPLIAPVAVAARSLFLPAALFALAISGWLAFQTVQLVGERQALGAARANLDPMELSATKLRTALDALATATAKLAAEGNANARVIVEELRKRGVTINPAGAQKPAQKPAQ